MIPRKLSKSGIDKDTIHHSYKSSIGIVSKCILTDEIKISDNEIAEFFDKHLREEIEPISLPSYPFSLDGGLNPALKIFSSNGQNRIESGRWEIFVVLKNEFGKVGLRSGIKSRTTGSGGQKVDLKVMEQFESAAFAIELKKCESILNEYQSGHPSLALNFEFLDNGIFRTLPVFIGGWLIRNDDHPQNRLQVYWSSGRYNRDLSARQIHLVQLCVSFNLMMEYGKDFKVEFYKFNSIKIENFIAGKVADEKAYDWKFVVKEVVRYEYHNFFERYFIGNAVDKVSLLSEVMNLTFKENKFPLNDISLKEIFQKYAKDNANEFKSYYINHVLFHALMTSVENWTELFFELFSKILKLFNSEEKYIPDPSKGDYYPISLRVQLVWLGKLYTRQKSNTGSIGDQPKTAFPMVYYPRDKEDLIQILKKLPDNLCKTICEKIKDKLSEMIKTADDFRSVISDLNENLRDAVYETLKDKLPGMIETENNFTTVIFYLNTDQCRSVCEKIRDKLVEIIRTPSNFNDALRHLDYDQRCAVYENIHDKLSHIIETIHDLKDILRYLNENQRMALCEAIKDKLPKIIKTASAFKEFILWINKDCRNVVLDLMKENLPEIIETIDDIKIVFSSYQWSSVVYPNIEDKLPKLIGTANDFCRLLYFLNESQRNAAYEKLKFKFPEFIKTSSDFSGVLCYLNEDQRHAVCMSIKVELLIEEPSDVEFIFLSLRENQCRMISEIIKSKLLEIIKTTFDLRNLVFLLSDAKRRVVCETIKDKLTMIVQSYSDFQHVTDRLPINEEKETGEAKDIHISAVSAKINFGNYLLNLLLFSHLDRFIVGRSSHSCFFVRPIKQNVREAIEALKIFRQEGGSIDKNYVILLKQGKLGKCINTWLANYMPSRTTMDEFLGQPQASLRVKEDHVLSCNRFN